MPRFTPYVLPRPHERGSLASSPGPTRPHETEPLALPEQNRATRLYEKRLEQEVVLPPALQITNLCKTFGKKGQQRAVDHLSLKIGQGEIFGLLGPNGSGKTTTLNMLSGLISPSSGEIRILGFDASRHIRHIRQRLGVVAQETALYEELSAWTNLEFHADLYGIAQHEKTARITQMLQLVSLLERKDSRVSTFSGGMKRRLAIARALLHDPQMFYLDEPTIGVDVQSRAAIWSYIRTLRQQGKTILLTTNYLEEAQALCDRLAILDHGRLMVIDTPDRLRQRYGGSVISLEIHPFSEHKRLDFAAFQGFSEVVSVKQQEKRVVILTRGAENRLAAYITLLTTQGEITDITLRETNLDEVFLRLTGSALRD